MEDNKPERNYNRNQKTKVELDRTHNQKEYKAVDRMALDWNPHGSRARGRPRNTWNRTVLEEIAKEGKTWNEVKKVGNEQGPMEIFCECPLLFKRRYRRLTD